MDYQFAPRRFARRSTFAAGYVRLTMGALLVLVLAACASVPSLPPTHAIATASVPEQRAMPARQRALRAHYARWHGTPYRYGGASATGVDCSGFVQLTYARLFAHRLPRVTASQRRAGREVGRAPLAVGDLVFFSIDGKDSHVGIYTGDGAFIHASTRRGVVTDRLDSPYWARHYSGGVRVLPDGA